MTYYINETCKKATNAITSMGRIRKYITKENLKLLVNALVISRLDYCNSILYDLLKQELDKLQRIQNTAARLITGTTGSPISSCERIILHNNSHSGIIRACMRIFMTALRNKKIRQILNKNTSPYFHSLSLIIWPLTLMKEPILASCPFRGLQDSSTYIRKALFLYTFFSSK